MRDILANRTGWHQYLGTSEDGTRLTVFVTAGEQAFAQAEHLLSLHFLVLAVPPGEDPSVFDWSLLSGFEPILLEVVPHDPGTEETVATAIIHDGIKRVLVVPSGQRYVRGAMG